MQDKTELSREEKAVVMRAWLMGVTSPSALEELDTLAKQKIRQLLPDGNSLVLGFLDWQPQAPYQVACLKDNGNTIKGEKLLEITNAEYFGDVLEAYTAFRTRLESGNPEKKSKDDE